MNISIDAIAAIVSLQTGVTLGELRGKTRHTAITRARRMLVGLIRDFTHHSFPDIAEWYGPGCHMAGITRSHSTVVTQLQHHERLRVKDRRYRDEYLRMANLVREQKKQLTACKLAGVGR